MFCLIITRILLISQTLGSKLVTLKRLVGGVNTKHACVDMVTKTKHTCVVDKVTKTIHTCVDMVTNTKHTMSTHVCIVLVTISTHVCFVLVTLSTHVMVTKTIHTCVDKVTKTKHTCVDMVTKTKHTCVDIVTKIKLRRNKTYYVIYVLFVFSYFTSIYIYICIHTHDKNIVILLVYEFQLSFFLGKEHFQK
jgi:hypothetical protein